MWTSCIFALLLTSTLLGAKPSELNSYDVTAKMQEILKLHAVHKTFTPLIAKRALQNFIDGLDPTKTYFLQAEIDPWLSPSDEKLARMVKDFEYSNFGEFKEIASLMRRCIERRRRFEEALKEEELPKGVTSKEFQKISWCTSEEALYDRLKRMRSRQLEVTAKLDGEVRLLAMSRLDKRRQKIEEELMSPDAHFRDKIFCTDVLKALASSLDAHTHYFTPAEAHQFLLSVQQRLLGIGVQLRDDIDGFSIIKFVEGSPAELSGELRLKDKIIAVDREPVVGMDAGDVVELIRGREGTDVVLTVLREGMSDGKKVNEVREIRITRREVVLQDGRVEASFESFGDGVMVCLRLHSFYQDAGSSSAADLERAFKEIAAEHKVLGVLLDLRFNGGGLLPQAVDVTGLFIKRGVVVSIKDETGEIQRFRNLDAKMMWDGPLVVLVNRLSASCAEIVAQSLQDYGRGLIVGDDRTFGKGSFQIFTLTTEDDGVVDPQGEYKVSRGEYYGVSGKTPQPLGMTSDIYIPSELCFMEIGEQFAQYPLENDSIAESFEDSFSDIPFFQRARLRKLYALGAQERENRYQGMLEQLKKNSEQRIQANQLYQKALDHMKRVEAGEELPEEDGNDLLRHWYLTDMQLGEAMNVLRDTIWLMREQSNSAQALEKKAA